MVFKREAAQTKLDAIKTKNVDKIVADQVYIPGLGGSYTKQQLLQWAKPKIDLLQDLIDAENAQVRLEILTPIYQSMTPAGKNKVAMILNGTYDDPTYLGPSPFDINDPEYNKLTLARLVHFADPDLRVP